MWSVLEIGGPNPVDLDGLGIDWTIRVDPGAPRLALAPGGSRRRGFNSGTANDRLSPAGACRGQCAHRARRVVRGTFGHLLRTPPKSFRGMSTVGSSVSNEGFNLTVVRHWRCSFCVWCVGRFILRCSGSGSCRAVAGPRRPKRWTIRPACGIPPYTGRGFIWPSAPLGNWRASGASRSSWRRRAVPPARHIIGLVTAARLADDRQRRSKNVLERRIPLRSHRQ